jgi:hypothetical protein
LVRGFLSQPGTPVHLQVYGFGPDHPKQGDECQADQKNPEFYVLINHHSSGLMPINP